MDSLGQTYCFEKYRRSVLNDPRRFGHTLQHMAFTRAQPNPPSGKLLKPTCRSGIFAFVIISDGMHRPESMIVMHS